MTQQASHDGAVVWMEGILSEDAAITPVWPSGKKASMKVIPVGGSHPIDVTTTQELIPMIEERQPSKEQRIMLRGILREHPEGTTVEARTVAFDVHESVRP